MRSFLAAAVTAFVLAGGASLPAEASAGAGLRGMAAGDRGVHRGQLHLARYVFDNDARGWRMDGRTGRLYYDAGPGRTRATRHANRSVRHTRSAKRAWRSKRHAGGQRRVVRRSVHSTARNLVRIRPTRSTVLALPEGSDITGIASYYWQGQRTATGERYNPEGMTAAHRTLPFGTRVRVTHLGNGRSVDVRINDRGPYIGGRIIDLSRGAAGILGMHHQGVARVKVTVIGR